MRISGRRGTSSEEAVLRLVQEHAAELLRFARRFSYCADDAHDAYQRSLEILVRRMRTDPPAQPLAWLRTVLRHESLLVRAQRGQLVGREEFDFDRHQDRSFEDPADRVVGHEQLSQTAEALQRLKPQEVTALVLRAEGLSYKEICERTGWTYTRCNRAVTEGRRALLTRLGAIESGAECRRWLPLLSRLADGEATSVELAELRPHLRGCPACRATLRRAYATPAQVAAVVPPVLVSLAAVQSGDSLLRHVEFALNGLAERTTRAALRVQGAFDALPGAKLAAVAASTAALAGGGVAIEHASGGSARAGAVAASPAAAGAELSGTALGASPPVAARWRREAAAGRRSEFSPQPEGDPEFARRAAPTAEFASSEPAAGVAVAAPDPPTPMPTPEFVGP